jgi:pilus assembly protein CpaB
MAAGRGRRTGLILVVVVILLLLVGGAGLLFVLGLLGGGGPGPTTVEATPTQQIIVKRILVAARDIPRGARLSEQDVEAVEWPDSVLAAPAGSLDAGSDAEPALDQVNDRIARTDILRGQPILEGMLTPGDQPTDLASIGSNAALQIPAGQVAVAVPINRLAAVAYAIRPGDHLDVLMSFRFVDVDEDFQTLLPNGISAVLFPAGVTPIGEGNGVGEVQGREEPGPFGTTVMVMPSLLDEGSQRPRQTTQLVLKNVIVLRIGDWPLTDQAVVAVTPDPNAPPATTDPNSAPPTPVPQPLPDVVTLIMSRQDALVLKYAYEVGADIDYALRSVLDNDVNDVTTDSVTLQYIIDFYNVVQPPKLPISFDPRLDALFATNGSFPPPEGVATTQPPPP